MSLRLRRGSPYVPVAERRRQAREGAGQAREAGPARRAGRRSKAARSPAASGASRGASNLERYSDYANRLPRGRTYVRNGSVVDLQIAAGEVDGDGQRLGALRDRRSRSRRSKPPQWKCDLPRLRGRDRLAGRAAAGALVEGRDGAGLPRGRRPVPGAARRSSCRAAARTGRDMCKHVAAVLYGVGARLDRAARAAVRAARRRPEGVDRGRRAGFGGRLRADLGKGAADDDMAALFGLEMAEAGIREASASDKPKPARRKKKAEAAKRSAARSPVAALTDGAGRRQRAARPSRERVLGLLPENV